MFRVSEFKVSALPIFCSDTERIKTGFPAVCYIGTMFLKRVKEDDIYQIFRHLKIRTIFFGQTNRPIDRQTDRQTNWQTDIVVHREVQKVSKVTPPYLMKNINQKCIINLSFISLKVRSKCHKKSIKPQFETNRQTDFVVHREVTLNTSKIAKLLFKGKKRIKDTMYLITIVSVTLLRTMIFLV